MSKFNIGDRIRTLCDGMYADVRVGDEGTVVEGSGLKPHGVFVKLDRLEDDYLFFYWNEIDRA